MSLHQMLERRAEEAAIALEGGYDYLSLGKEIRTQTGKESFALISDTACQNNQFRHKYLYQAIQRQCKGFKIFIQKVSCDFAALVGGNKHGASVKLGALLCHAGENGGGMKHYRLCRICNKCFGGAILLKTAVKSAGARSGVINIDNGMT